MEITVYGEQEWNKYAGQRGGKSEYLRLSSSEEFEFTVTRMTGPGNTSPRHKHDFDQIRYALKCDSEYAPGRVIPEGCFGYFPEGTHYGPFTLNPDMNLLSLQFQGASRCRFIDYDTLRAAQQALAQKGEFNKGVYTYTDDQGRKHNVDGHQAVVEFVTEQPLKVPKARYSDPLIIYPDAFEWKDAGNGGAYKELGAFTERRTTIGMIQLQKNGSYTVTSPERTTLLTMLKGSAQAAGKPLVARDAIKLQSGESLTISSAEGAELSLFGLPL